MVLSIVGGREMPESGLRWLQREPNLWNVAITRARSHLIVVGDLDFWRGRPGVVGHSPTLPRVTRRSSVDPQARRTADGTRQTCCIANWSTYSHLATIGATPSKMDTGATSSSIRPQRLSRCSWTTATANRNLHATYASNWNTVPASPPPECATQ